MLFWLCYDFWNIYILEYDVLGIVENCFIFHLFPSISPFIAGIVAVLFCHCGWLRNPAALGRWLLLTSQNLSIRYLQILKRNSVFPLRFRRQVSSAGGRCHPLEAFTNI